MRQTTTPAKATRNLGDVPNEQTLCLRSARPLGTAFGGKPARVVQWRTRVSPSSAVVVRRAPIEGATARRTIRL